MTIESRVHAARMALVEARQALRKAEAVIDELESEARTLRTVYREKPRGALQRVCQNPACGKPFTVRASDIRAGNKSGKFCCYACHVAVRRAAKEAESHG